MGLDTYASRSPEDIALTEEDLQAFSEANIELCGGIYSGGEGSFRGKVYATAILEITGRGLYQEWIPPETVREMYAALQACDPQEDSWDRVTPQEILELRRFFKVCSERGLGLINWS
jgi:hypothetical protein